MDNDKTILNELKYCIPQSDIIMTADLVQCNDITRSAIVQYFGTNQLIFNEEVLEDIKSMIGRREL